jgi:putative addiction module component (TIGR02574 family)
MSDAAHKVDLDALSVPERIQLVEDLWDSIAASADQIPLTEAQRQELDRRLDEYEAHPERVVSWEEVRSRIEARLRDGR